jgi:isopenicillin-N epimerase
MIASMATIPLPTPEKIPVFNYKSCDPLQDRLFNEFRIEIPFWYWGDPSKRHTRLSAQLYNSTEQYRFFAEVYKRLEK